MVGISFAGGPNGDNYALAYDYNSKGVKNELGMYAKRERGGWEGCQSNPILLGVARKGKVRKGEGKEREEGWEREEEGWEREEEGERGEGKGKGKEK